MEGLGKESNGGWKVRSNGMWMMGDMEGRGRGWEEVKREGKEGMRDGGRVKK